VLSSFKPWFPIAATHFTFKQDSIQDHDAFEPLSAEITRFGSGGFFVAQFKNRSLSNKYARVLLILTRLASNVSPAFPTFLARPTLCLIVWFFRTKLDSLALEVRCVSINHP